MRVYILHSKRPIHYATTEQELLQIFIKTYIDDGYNEKNLRNIRICFETEHIYYEEYSVFWNKWEESADEFDILEKINNDVF
jgi:hypothetical protein